MYILEVKLDGESIFLFQTLELQEILEEVADWANDERGLYDIRIRQLPRMKELL